jgi:hypothetical protein
VWVERLELPHLAIGAPPQVAVPGVAQIELRDLLEAARGLEARRQFVGKRLVVDKPVCPCRADGLVVKVHRIKRPVFETSDLRPEQCSAVGEVLRAMLRPRLDLPAVCGQRFDVLLPFAGRGKVARSCMGKPGIKVVLSRFEL